MKGFSKLPSDVQPCLRDAIQQACELAPDHVRHRVGGACFQLQRLAPLPNDDSDGGYGVVGSHHGVLFVYIVDSTSGRLWHEYDEPIPQDLSALLQPELQRLLAGGNK